MRLVVRAAVLAAAVLAGDPRRLPAQSIDRSAIGAHARVEACDAAGERRTYERTGELHSQDGAAVVLDGRRGRDTISTSRIRRLELRTKRSRELEGAGLLVGMMAGVLVLPGIAGGRDIGTGLLLIPVVVIGGGIVGYQIGAHASGEEEWAPLPLAPGHGSECRS